MADVIGGKTSCFAHLLQHGQNYKYMSPASTSIPHIVKRIEGLFDLINTEFMTADDKLPSGSELHVEAWSQEITQLCQRVNELEITSLDDLRAKVSLSMTLIMQSHIDKDIFEAESANIINFIDSFKPNLPI